VRRHEVAGLCITPGLIDCHTHLVYGGNRAREFAQRLGGVSYEEIARSGGDIRSTVAATRAASDEELLASALLRARALQAEGVTTVEVKSGYGLDLPTELRMLRTARALERHLPLSVRTTYLGLHALPPDYAADRAAYVALASGPWLDAAVEAGLADAVDAFCDAIAFSAAETSGLLAAARRRGLAIHLHADQLSNIGAAALAADVGASSADHLEYTDPEGVHALARSGTVAVLLPGAYFTLRQAQPPPVALLREAGVPMAVATDCNPGSSPCTSILLMLNMACTLFGLTPEEALAAVTRQAAQALGLAHDRGTVEVGKRADLALWKIADPAELAYGLGMNRCAGLIQAGRPVRPAQCWPAAASVADSVTT
jgi:imidazolonepropionase